jgi:hypothetical protein
VVVYLRVSKVLIEVRLEGFPEAGSKETGAERGMEWWRLVWRKFVER